jgi:transcriptional regulator GlxA family with amidase domain
MHRAQSAPGTGSSWSFVLLDPARLLPGLVEDREALSAAALSGERFPNILRAAAHPELVAAVRSLVAELEARRDGHRPVVRGLVLTIMGLLQRLAPAAPDARGAARRDAAEKIAPALDHLSRRYAEPLAMEELAAMCCTSGSNLRRLFRQVTGRAPREYLTYLRVQMAAALLESTRLRVLDIAARVGYPTLSGFNRHFRRVAGRSPRQWRRSPAVAP